jgi:RimJ/RimL family protein N-acetyltransferase
MFKSNYMQKFKEIIVKNKSNQTVTIRQAKTDDAALVYAFTKAMVIEDQYQLLTIDEIDFTLESEKSWIEFYEKDACRIILLAFIDGELVGSLDFCNSHRIRLAHTGEFGMSVANKYRNQGIGTLLVNCLLDWASNNPSLEKITLSVHQNNEPALAIYKKLQFKIEGTKTREIKYADGSYVDMILMAKFLNNS